MTQFDSSTQVASSATHSQENSEPGGQQSTPKRVGIEIDSTFCPTEAESPFDTTEWELRTAAIKGENGQLLFSCDSSSICCHVHWSVGLLISPSVTSFNEFV